MKCWKSVFNAEGLRVIIQVVHVGAVKTYVAPVEALRDKERHDGSLQSKLLEKTSLGPSFFFLVKLSFPVTSLMPWFSPLLAGPNE
jgi:hypothetical protein